MNDRNDNDSKNNCVRCGYCIVHDCSGTKTTRGFSVELGESFKIISLASQMFQRPDTISPDTILAAIKGNTIAFNIFMKSSPGKPTYLTTSGDGSRFRRTPPIMAPIMIPAIVISSNMFLVSHDVHRFTVLFVDIPIFGGAGNKN